MGNIVTKTYDKRNSEWGQRNRMSISPGPRSCSFDTLEFVPVSQANQLRLSLHRTYRRDTAGNIAHNSRLTRKPDLGIILAGRPKAVPVKASKFQCSIPDFLVAVFCTILLSQLGRPASGSELPTNPTCGLKARAILLNGAGWATRKLPATGEVFFPDSLHR